MTKNIPIVSQNRPYCFSKPSLLFIQNIPIFLKTVPIITKNIPIVYPKHSYCCFKSSLLFSKSFLLCLKDGYDGHDIIKDQDYRGMAGGQDHTQIRSKSKNASNFTKISDQISFGMEIKNIILSKSQNLVKTLKTCIKPLKSKLSK